MKPVPVEEQQIVSTVLSQQAVDGQVTYWQSTEDGKQSLNFQFVSWELIEIEIKKKS